MNENKNFSTVKWYNADGVDAPGDEIPDLTEQWFETADQYKNGKLVKKGRPFSENKKVAVTIRLDKDIVTKLRESGKGWQSRLNEFLKRNLAALG